MSHSFHARIPYNHFHFTKRAKESGERVRREALLDARVRQEVEKSTDGNGMV